MKKQFYSSSEQGPRDYQQDRFLHYSEKDTHTLLVADGMGGHPNGDLAAQDIVDSILENKSLGLFTVARIADSKCRNRRDHSGSTMSGLVLHITNNEYTLQATHIGDSLIKIFSHYNGKLTKLYQSIPQETPYGSITNCIGFLIEEEVERHTEKAKLHEKESLVIFLATDGLFESVTDFEIEEEILKAIQNPSHDPAKELVTLSLQTTEDNTTCVIGIFTAE